MKTMAIRVTRPGGPEVLRWEEIDVPAPGPGEVLVRHTAIGLNYIDVYQRQGLYPLPPAGIPGSEGAGRVEAVGEGVTEFRVGDRIAYGNSPPGAYAVHRLLPAHRLVKLPEGVGEQLAAAAMLKGMTAEFLLRRVYEVKDGDTLLFHAAAGGVGSIAVQWAKALGAKVIGTVSTDEKAALAAKHGCDFPIVTSREDFVARVKEITGGKGVPVVYDSVGKDTFLRSFECLRTRGMLVLFGQSSGVVGPFDVGMLAKGSYFLTRPSLFAYCSDRTDLLASANALFAQLRAGTITVDIQHTWPLEQAAEAHRALESRRTTGPGLLLPP